MKRLLLLLMPLLVSVSAQAADINSLVTTNKKLNELNAKLAAEEQRLNSVKSFKKNSGRDLFKLSSVLSRPAQERSVEAQIKSLKAISALRTEIYGLEKQISAAQPEISKIIISGNYPDELLNISHVSDQLRSDELLKYRFLETYTIDIKEIAIARDFLSHRLKSQDKMLSEIKDMITWLNLKKSLLKGLSEPQIKAIDTSLGELNTTLKKGTDSQDMIKKIIKGLK